MFFFHVYCWLLITCCCSVFLEHPSMILLGCNALHVALQVPWPQLQDIGG